MPYTILVPLDGSTFSERALPTARGLAAGDGRLLVMRVVAAPEPPLYEGYFESLVSRAEAEAYLEGLARSLHPAPVTTFVREGEPTAMILDEIAARRVDVVVMSTHGRSGVGRWVYGSVADAIMRRSPVPVLLVPAVGAVKGFSTDRPPRVLVPLDGSSPSESALGAAVDLAAVLGAELVLLSVTESVATTDPYGMIYSPIDVGADESRRQEYLERVASGLRASGRVVTVRVGFGHPADGIVAGVRDEGADVVAMSTHGAGGVSRLLMGSVTSTVVQRSPVPVLVVRPVAARGQVEDAPEHVGATAGEEGLPPLSRS